MLRAEVESTLAFEGNGSPEAGRQVELLSEAVNLAPGRPNLPRATGARVRRFGR
jgi:hypothetical protein